MIKIFTLAALAVSTFAAATVFSQTEASAQWVERPGTITGPTQYKWNGRIVTQEEFRALQKADADRKSAKQREMDRQQKMKQEMAAEARAYEKMKQERQRSAPTTEHCYMKNGNLECKPAP